MHDRDACGADADLGAVIEPAIDAFLGDVDLTAAHQHRGPCGAPDRVVRQPVILVPVGCDDGSHTTLRGDGSQQRLLFQRHVDEQRIAAGKAAHDVGIVVVRPHRADLHDADVAVLDDGEVRISHEPPA